MLCLPACLSPSLPYAKQCTLSRIMRIEAELHDRGEPLPESLVREMEDTMRQIRMMRFRAKRNQEEEEVTQRGGAMQG